MIEKRELDSLTSSLNSTFDSELLLLSLLNHHSTHLMQHYAKTTGVSFDALISLQQSLIADRLQLLGNTHTDLMTVNNAIMRTSGTIAYLNRLPE